MTVEELIELLKQIPDKNLQVIYDDYEQGRCRDWEWYYVNDDDNNKAIELRPTLI